MHNLVGRFRSNNDVVRIQASVRFAIFDPNAADNQLTYEHVSTIPSYPSRLDR